MSRSEIAVLRTKLRELNIECSALVRSKMGEGRFPRMGELKVERRALMALIAEDRLRDAGYHMAARGSAGALSLAGSEIDAALSSASSEDVCSPLPPPAAPAASGSVALSPVVG